MNRRLWRETGALAVLALVVVVVFWPVVTGRATFVPTDMLRQLVLPFAADVKMPAVQNHYTFDVLRQFYPAYLFFQESIHAGEWPLWNPHILGGHPAFASSMYSFANPFNVLFWFLPMPAAFDWRIILQFFAAMCAMYALLRHWQLRITACLFGAIAYGLNSQFLFNYWYGGFQTFVWVPVVILFLERAWGPHPGLLPQTAGARGTDPAVPAALDASPPSPSAGERAGVRGAWANSLLAGIFLGCAFLAGNLQSAAFAALLAVLYSLCSRRLLTGSTALALGTGVLLATVQWLPFLELLRHSSPVAGRATTFADGLKALPFTLSFLVPGIWGSTETFDLLKFAHATAGDFQAYTGIAAAIPAIMAVAAWREPRVKVLATCAGAILAALLFVPPVRQFLYCRFLCAFVFCLAPLAAFGLDAPVNRRVARAIAVLFALMAAGLVLVRIASEPLWEYAQRIVSARAAASAFALSPEWQTERLLGFWQHFYSPAFWLPVVLGALTLALLRHRWAGTVLLVFVAFDLGWMARRVVPMCEPGLPVPAEIAHLGAGRIAVESPPGRWLLPDNLVMAYGLSSVTGYESLAPRPGASPSNATHLISMSGGSGLPPATLANTAGRGPQVAPTGAIRVEPNPNFVPRARFIGSPAQISLASKPQRVVVRVCNDQPGELVLADTFYPGWEATVNGTPQPIRRFEQSQRAVALPAGDNEVVFHYRPASVRLGALVSGLGLLAALGVWLACRQGGR